MITVLKRFLLIMNPTMKELDFFGGSTLREPRVGIPNAHLTNIACNRALPTYECSRCALLYCATRFRLASGHSHDHAVV